MKKIPSLFMMDNHFITREVNPQCQWVMDGEGIPTPKYDGTACMVKDQKLYKRYDNSILQGKEIRVQKNQPLEDWIHCEDTSERGKFIYWIPVTSKDYYHQIGWGWARAQLKDDTYELVGPDVQGNPHKLEHNSLVLHGSGYLSGCMFINCNKCDNPRTFDDIKRYLKTSLYEGIVWHHPDGRMCKITKNKFGFPWGE